MTLLTAEQLAPDTVKTYRSKLRRLWLSLPSLGVEEAHVARQKIIQLEGQLGIKAETIGGPGRPRRFAHAPPNADH